MNIIKKVLTLSLALSVFLLSSSGSVFALSSAATMTGTSALTADIQTGIDTSTSTPVYIGPSTAFLNNVVPTTPTWVTSNPDVGPLNNEVGLYNYQNAAPCSTAVATGFNVKMQGIKLQFNGADVDDANAGATIYLVNPSDNTTVPAATINSGIKDGSWVSGGTVDSNGVARGYNLSAMPSGTPLVGEFNADYAITSDPGELIELQILVKQGMSGGFVTATNIETSTPVVTVTWDDSSCSPTTTTPPATTTTTSTIPAAQSSALAPASLANTGESHQTVIAVAVVFLAISSLAFVKNKLSAKV